MQHSLSWEANYFYTLKGIPKITRNPTVNHLKHNSLLNVPILSRVDSVHTPSHALKFNFKTIVPSTPLCPNWSHSIKIGYIFYKFIMQGQFILRLHFTFCHIFYLSLSLWSQSHSNFQYTHRPYNAHCIHLQLHAQISVYFNQMDYFIYCFSLLTSSESTHKLKLITYSKIPIYVCMFSTNINQQ